VLKTGKDSDKFSIPKRGKQIKTNGGKARKAKQMECFFFFSELATFKPPVLSVYYTGDVVEMSLEFNVRYCKK